MKAYRNCNVCSWLLLLLLSHLCLSMKVQSTEAPTVPFKAVNLGGWLVTEGWITPSLFSGNYNHIHLHNKDLLDGTQVQFKSIARKKYLSAEKGGGSTIVANKNIPLDWETFKLWRVAHDRFQFRVHNKQFVRLNRGRAIVAKASTSGESETFQIFGNPYHPERVHIKALSNGMFLQANSEGTVTADFSGKPDWEDSNNKAVFEMKFGRQMKGEFQITNGYGPERASQVMNDHWNTFIVEDDFAFIARNGLNSVRIPVGWWTAMNPTPPPFVEGSLQVLDQAFRWAEKYHLKVILDLHAPPDAQNEGDHSGSRDGTIEFGSTQETIHRAVEVIKFFSERYARSPSLAAVGLINEPRAPDASSPEALTKYYGALVRYYKAGYAAVRKHSSTAYVIMSDRQGSPHTLRHERVDLAKQCKRVVIDVHFYNLYEPKFSVMNVKQNIHYIKKDRRSELTSISEQGLLSFVGEWTAKWEAKDAKIGDNQSFAKAQLDVYGRASFGWAYWTLKTEEPQPWSLQWVIKNEIIKRNWLPL